MDAYIILYPVFAFILAVVIGRIGTIIMDDIRKDSTPETMDDDHVPNSTHQFMAKNS